jgi:hypothetical protein
VDADVRTDVAPSVVAGVRLFQLDLIESGLSIPNRNRIMSGAKFLFRVTLRRLDLVASSAIVATPTRRISIFTLWTVHRRFAPTGYPLYSPVLRIKAC